jgi:hypothetical protein
VGGSSLINGRTFGCAIAIVGAGLDAIAAPFSISGSNPWWSLAVFFLCTSNALTYVFAAGIALLLIGLAALWSAMMLNKTPRFWAHRRQILVRATEPVRWSRRTRRG